MLMNIFFSQGLYPWVFSTYIGSYLSNFGKMGTIVLLSLSSLHVTYIMKIKMRDAICLSDLLILILYIQVISWGVFYFRQYSANLYLIVTFLISILFKHNKRSSRRIICSSK
jgi:hypothetical protein